MIPAEAVEAAAEWLPHSDDCEALPQRDCTCWQPRVNLMREALEAAHPILLTELRKAHEALERVEGIADKWWANFPSKARDLRAAVAAAKGDEE